MINATWSALVDPRRRSVLNALMTEPCSVNELVDELGISQPGVSKHLKVLREAGLVSVRKEGQQRFYELAPEALKEVDEWLEPYRKLWAAPPTNAG